MSSITNAIRQRRFDAVAGESIFLLIETEMGEKFDLEVINASLSGLGTRTSDPHLMEVLQSGAIIPESKIHFADNEISLGRLVLRRIEKSRENTVICAFSLIDTKVPLFGAMSKNFNGLAKGENVFEYELGHKRFNLSSFVDNDYRDRDLFQRCRDYAVLSKQLHATPLWQYYATRHKVEGMNSTLSLPKQNKPQRFVNFGSYDYFGYSFHPQVIEACSKATREFGVSATATPPLSGRSKYHEELEHKLARLLRKEDTVLFNSAFAANVGGITSLLGLNDIAIADVLSHASIHDGLNAARAKVRLFRHNDNEHLEKLLKEHRNQFAGMLTIHEGLFSMDGDVPDLRKFLEISKKYEARTFVDEVHSFGVIGPEGLGACERHGVLDDVDLFIGTLNKGFGAGGGFICASKEVCNWLRGFARTHMFSSCLSPGHAAAAITALDLNFKNSENLKRLRSNIKFFLDGLKEMDVPCISDAESPIVPVIIGDQNAMADMNKIMLEHGVFVNTIVYPAVAVDACRFRFSISAAHQESDLKLALMAFKNAIQSTGFSFKTKSKNNDNAVVRPMKRVAAGE